jgi:tryptophanyl-tRNA synthetase
MKGRYMKRIVSGITPSGDGALHIGNYLGAVKQFIEFAKDNECFLFIADLHALTTIQNKENLQLNVQNLILNELALLGELKNIVFFRQSDVPMHTELQSILNNITPLGLLRRAHAYKDKLQKAVMEDDINLGLFNYPILMAADILLYKPQYVPVGKDQKQHVEICRDVAGQFNKIYKSNVFPLPDSFIPQEVAVVMGTDGKRKMSKSLGNIISIFEDESVIKKQVMGTYTDPTRIHANDPGHIEGNMVFTYLDFFGDKKIVSEYKEKYKQGKVGDMEVKQYLFESLMTYFGSARARYQELKNNPEKVKQILQDGAAKAKEAASKTMMEVRRAVGLTNTYAFFQY